MSPTIIIEGEEESVVEEIRDHISESGIEDRAIETRVGGDK